MYMYIHDCGKHYFTGVWVYNSYYNYQHYASALPFSTQHCNSVFILFILLYTIHRMELEKLYLFAIISTLLLDIMIVVVAWARKD